MFRNSKKVRLTSNDEIMQPTERQIKIVIEDHIRRTISMNGTQVKMVPVRLEIMDVNKKVVQSLYLHELNHKTTHLFDSFSEKDKIEVFFEKIQKTFILPEKMNKNLIHFFKQYKPKDVPLYCCHDFAYEIKYARENIRVEHHSSESRFDRIEAPVAGDLIVLFQKEPTATGEVVPIHSAIYIGHDLCLSLSGVKGPLIVTTLSEIKKVYASPHHAVLTSDVNYTPLLSMNKNLLDNNPSLNPSSFKLPETLSLALSDVKLSQKHMALNSKSQQIATIQSRFWDHFQLVNSTGTLEFDYKTSDSIRDDFNVLLLIICLLAVISKYSDTESETIEHEVDPIEPKKLEDEDNSSVEVLPSAACPMNPDHSSTNRDLVGSRKKVVKPRNLNDQETLLLKLQSATTKEEFRLIELLYTHHGVMSEIQLDAEEIDPRRHASLKFINANGSLNLYGISEDLLIKMASSLSIKVDRQGGTIFLKKGTSWTSERQLFAKEYIQRFMANESNGLLLVKDIEIQPNDTAIIQYHPGRCIHVKARQQYIILLDSLLPHEDLDWYNSIYTHLKKKRYECANYIKQMRDRSQQPVTAEEILALTQTAQSEIGYLGTLIKVSQSNLFAKKDVNYSEAVKRDAPYSGWSWDDNSKTITLFVEKGEYVAEPDRVISRFQQSNESFTVVSLVYSVDAKYALKATEITTPQKHKTMACESSNETLAKLFQQV